MHACLTYSAHLPWRINQVWRDCHGHRFVVIAFNKLGWAILKMIYPFNGSPVTQKSVPESWRLDENASNWRMV